jgi:CBS domain containing-hemolysin-like protein
LLHQLEHGRISPMSKLMRPVVSAPATTPADRLLVMFREQRSQQAMVTNEQGSVIGLVTLEDALAELFGDLGDEFKIRRNRRRRDKAQAREHQEDAP